MATIDLGKIKLVWRGTYNNSTAYTVDDIVEFTDSGITSTYICVANSTGNNPSSGGTAHASWNYMAKGVVDPIPSQSGNAGKFLKTDGTNLSYDSAGITMVQTWRLTTSFSIPSSNTFLTSNFEIADTYSYGGIGASMTESSGVFTFPSTGIYVIQFIGIHTANSQANWSQTEIHITQNNSSYNSVAFGYANIDGSGSYQSSYCQFMFDVTDTSTHKLKFGCRGSNSNTDLIGHTNENNTTFQFTKLGDT
mgnify:FL=1